MIGQFLSGMDGCGGDSEAILSNIEKFPPEPVGLGACVGYEHFGDGGAVENGAEWFFGMSWVFELHAVEDKAFSEIKAESKVPALPADCIALECVGSAVREVEGERFGGGAWWGGSG